MLEARLQQAAGIPISSISLVGADAICAVLKKLLDAIKELVSDCNLDCNDSGTAPHITRPSTRYHRYLWDECLPRAARHRASSHGQLARGACEHASPRRRLWSLPLR